MTKNRFQITRLEDRIAPSGIRVFASVGNLVDAKANVKLGCGIQANVTANVGSGCGCGSLLSVVGRVRL